MKNREFPFCSGLIFSLKLVEFFSGSEWACEFARDQRAFTPTPTQHPKLGVGVVWELASPDREREQERGEDEKNGNERPTTTTTATTTTRRKASRVRSVARVR